MEELAIALEQIWEATPGNGFSGLPIIGGGWDLPEVSAPDVLWIELPDESFDVAPTDEAAGETDDETLIDQDSYEFVIGEGYVQAVIDAGYEPIVVEGDGGVIGPTELVSVEQLLVERRNRDGETWRERLYVETYNSYWGEYQMRYGVTKDQVVRDDREARDITIYLAGYVDRDAFREELRRRGITERSRWSTGEGHFSPGYNGPYLTFDARLPMLPASQAMMVLEELETRVPGVLGARLDWRSGFISPSVFTIPPRRPSTYTLSPEVVPGWRDTWLGLLSDQRFPYCHHVNAGWFWDSGTMGTYAEAPATASDGSAGYGHWLYFERYGWLWADVTLDHLAYSPTGGTWIDLMKVVSVPPTETP